MPHERWTEALAEIADATQMATAVQAELGRVVGLELPQDMPKLVAAARLREALRAELWLPRSFPCSPDQVDFLTTIETDTDRVVHTPNDQNEARAWMIYLRLKRRAAALAQLELEAGDLVDVHEYGGATLEEVASIGGNGRVYFRGGAGAGAWPDNLTLRCKRTEATDELRQEAANRAAARARMGLWSEEKRRELNEFAVEQGVTEQDVEQLQAVIDDAADERPIQRFLEAHPQVLAALLGGNERFCIPHPRLGPTYVPDFMVADVDSLGIRWVLVELETPRTGVTLQTSNQLDERARKGVSQVQEWREWIQNNLASARLSRRQGGVGLVDIRVHSEGLVLVGRRALLHLNSEAVRSQIREQQNIRVHTYDWLIESLTGLLTFQGPRNANPFILRPQH